MSTDRRRYPRDSPGVRIRLSEDERERLRAVAEENGITLTELIRLGVMTLVEDYREGEVIFKRRQMQIASIQRVTDPTVALGKDRI